MQKDFEIPKWTHKNRNKNLDYRYKYHSKISP